MKKLILLIVFAFFANALYSQYPPAAGIMGSTAIHKDSSVFINWAQTCKVQRGYYDISHPTDSMVTNGMESDAVGISDFASVSLGDSGIAVLSFFPPIVDGTGFDFAVFENSFDGSFLELAYIEVSTDSVHWYRFNSTSLTQTDLQISTFGLLDPTKINNFAGKYKAFYGTPFDLQELIGSPFLNIDSVNYVKLIDVVGNISPQYANYDSQGNIVNDPWPTPFFTGGFDLDAVGVIHQQSQSITENKMKVINVWPNPCEDFIQISINGCGSYEIYTISGEIRSAGTFCNTTKVNTSDLCSGFYSVRVMNSDYVANSTFIKR